MANSNRDQLHTLARGEVEAILAELPEPLREKASALPVTYARRPNAAQRRDGIETDTLGLFLGSEFADEENAALPLPAQIILFLDNIWEQAEGDDELFGEEVRTTYLHELGHYLGLDEDDLFDRGVGMNRRIRLDGGRFCGILRRNAGNLIAGISDKR